MARIETGVDRPETLGPGDELPAPSRQEQLVARIGSSTMAGW